jgi:hypothetical protein
MRPDQIFVFGSNLAGSHGGGAAYAAYKEHGAEMGVAEGPTGRSYAIPTVDASIVPLPLTDIHQAVARFLAYARAHPDSNFSVTRIGCGIAGYTDAEIGPMFNGATPNIELPDGWGM